jgi:phage shock protein PspC (stress-responsive transcriptional regulator)
MVGVIPGFGEKLPVPPVVIFIYFVLFFLMDGRASVDLKKN